MAVEFYYELTGRKGKTLWDSMGQDTFDDSVAEQTSFYEKEAHLGGECREAFVDECLWKELDKDDLEDIIKGHPELFGKSNDGIKEWLLSNECPGIEEKEYIERWAFDRACSDAQTGVLWDHFDHGDDVEVALQMGLIKYPDMVNGEYVAIKGGRTEIPVDVANRILALREKMDKMQEGEERLEPAMEIRKLEREAAAKLILVNGFYCDIHDGRANYAVPIPRNEVLVCPSCGHPICPVCANCYDADPKTIEDASRYLASCDEVSGMAYCGECGDWGEGFMLRFLRLVNCPIPPEYEERTSRPRRARFYATARVAELPDSGEIVAEVKRRFEEGTSGIIKIKHPTGEIWGFPERHPEGWIVTVLYPEER